MIPDEIRSWLWPWQIEWLRDVARWKVALKSRQIGFTEIIALEALLHAARHDGHQCLLISTKVGNARRQILNRIKHKWLPLLELDDVLGDFARGAEILKNEIHLANGSTVIATANDGGALRGNSRTSYWGDEVAFWSRRIHESIKSEIWPQIENPQNPNAVIRLVSTPWVAHDENLFYDIVEDKSGHHSQFALHHVDIVDALEADCDFEFDLEAAKQKHTRPDLLREYYTEFLELGAGYFDYTRLRELERSRDIAGALYCGVDLGKVNDYTSVVFVNSDGDDRHVEATYAIRSVNYQRQSEIIGDLIDQWGPVRAVADTTAHQGFADMVEYNLVASRGDRERKCRLTETVKSATESADLTFEPESSYVWDSDLGSFVEDPRSQVIEDLSKVKQTETAAGNIRYEATRDDTGHADSYSALLLAEQANGRVASSSATVTSSRGW